MRMCEMVSWLTRLSFWFGKSAYGYTDAKSRAQQIVAKLLYIFAVPAATPLGRLCPVEDGECMVHTRTPSTICQLPDRKARHAG